MKPNFYFSVGNRPPSPTGGERVQRLATSGEIEDAKAILAGDRSIEVDCHTFASEQDDGVWVQAWVRVTNRKED